MHSEDILEEVFFSPYYTKIYFILSKDEKKNTKYYHVIYLFIPC